MLWQVYLSARIEPKDIRDVVLRMRDDSTTNQVLGRTVWFRDGISHVSVAFVGEAEDVDQALEDLAPAGIEAMERGLRSAGHPVAVDLMDIDPADEVNTLDELEETADDLLHLDVRSLGPGLRQAPEEPYNTSSRTREHSVIAGQP